MFRGSRSKSTRTTKRYKRGRRSINLRRPASRVYRPIRVSQPGGISFQEPSKYALSLVDPFTYRGVRIPDLACHQSVCYSTEADFTVSLLTTSIAGLTPYDGVIIPLYGNNGWKKYNNFNGETGVATPFGNANTIQASYSVARLVSAQVIVKYAGNDVDSAGIIVGALLQASDGENGGTPAAKIFAAGSTLADASFDLLLDTGGSGQAPLAKRRGGYFGPVQEGLILRYKPTDADDFSYRTVGNGTGDQPGTKPIYDIPAAFMFGCPSTGAIVKQFSVSVVCNWESLPTDDQIGLAGVGTYVNPASQAFGLNSMAMLPTVSGATPTDFSKQDQVVRSIAASSSRR